ncbi:MAG: formylglycine-generating enzyme family protein [Gammaproteobacteria bacterium]|nr:formylglycine-generating enzyme family protein [Gammaproteobacteria bacterium]
MKKSVITLFILTLFFSANGYAALAKTAKGKDGATMVLIPAGEFVMGSDKVDKTGKSEEFGSIKPWYLDEHPQHTVKLDAFYMDKYEVTNGQFRDFVKQAGYRPPIHWVENGYVVSMKRDKLNDVSVEKLRNLVSEVFRIDVDTRNMGRAELLKEIDSHFAKLDKVPVYNVNWRAAFDYCKWAGKSLPTEEQWEKVARGEKGQEFPWGDEFKDAMSNTGEEEWETGAAPGGSYKNDHSVYPVFDIAGNVSEWTMDWYDAYKNSDFKSDLFGTRFKVVRGAGWGGSGHYALHMYQRGAYRLFLSPDSEHEDLGFRCAQAANDASLAGK